MGRKELRDFALRARKSLIEQAALKAACLGVTRDAAEDAACIWFIRLTCLWYMEVNGYLPDGVKGLSGIAKDCQHAEQQRQLVIRQCQKLSDVLPFVFGDSLGFEQFLLPDRLFDEGSVIRDMIDNISREEFLGNVQITGWLYQYFMSPKKDRVFAALKKNKKIRKEDIPAATQLFTPDWIVKYMVENSLGRLWMEAHPGNSLKPGWHYYIEEDGQNPGMACRSAAAVKELKPLSPEEIKVLDPAMGSGHILVYAFDVLYYIYLSAGYKEERIPALILEENLYGLDIDERASALACFALIMKARSQDEGLFRKSIRLNLYPIRESIGLADTDVLTTEFLKKKGPVAETLRRDLCKLLETFRDAGEFGSVINMPDLNLKGLAKWWEDLAAYKNSAAVRPKCNPVADGRIMDLINQAMVMTGKYHVVVTNPPYMGIRGMNARLADYLNTHYKTSKHDLFTVFMDIAKRLTLPGGYMALINQHSWMFLSSYRKFREEFLRECRICSLLHLGSGVFGGDVGTIVQPVAFAARKMPGMRFRSVFINLQDYSGPGAKEQVLLDKKGDSKDVYHTVCISDLEGIPGKPIAYWAGESAVRAFSENKKLGELAQPRQGMATSDNSRFLRYWYEVPPSSIGFGCRSADEALKSGRRWFPYNKGGSYRKWYGNNSLVVNWEDDGREIKELAASLYGNYTRTIKNIGYYFKEAITYTFISNEMGVRYSPPGFIFDVAGSSVFAKGDDLYIVLAFLCSKLSGMFLKILNPTFNIQVGDIKNLPVVRIEDAGLRERIIRLARENIEICKFEWDARETSWDFKRHPLLEYRKGADTIEKAYSNWHCTTEMLFGRLKSNEEELNGILIDLYGLGDILTPEVEERDITIEKADEAKTVKSFISYAVGCMFGRYFPDGSGPVNEAGVPDHGEGLKRMVKEDNIIPVMGGEYFGDNISSRFEAFVQAVFGAGTLEVNLEFIAGVLGKRHGETSRAAIGRYFDSKFYKDHIDLYNNRPVYWMFSSGRERGFKALIYVHRYSSSTLRVLHRGYLQRVTKGYRYELDRFEADTLTGKGTVQGKILRKRQEVLTRRLEECVIYGRALERAAREGIVINLDDGIPSNYSRFQHLRIPGREGIETISVNLLASLK